MKLPNPLKRKPGLNLEFECTACDRSFKRKVRWLYIDPEIVKQNQGRIESTDADEFLIPERIICPHCQAVDQFKFAPSVFGHATTALLKGLLGGKMDPDDPIQFAEFGLADGRKMHPRKAVEMYAAQVAEQPEQPELRVKYANTLCTLGYREEAETEYRTVLSQDATNLDALLNLAALLIGRNQTQEGHEYLHRLIACAEESAHPQRVEYIEVSQGVLDGDLKIEGIDVFIHFAPTDPSKPLPASIPPPPTVRLEPSQKRRPQRKPKRKRKKRRGRQPPRN
jgi:tetratricopeptide (TPR) repeat protein